ncbi:LysR family transcriptional regulator substrate-binding protein [Streptomyces antimycoticus]|uniref:LysR family transcriptional regulator substrate-binding protein n=1 Tax=Streptomyces antimycoticus TaxID=68175 RepID=UPI0036758570
MGSARPATPARFAKRCRGRTSRRTRQGTAGPADDPTLTWRLLTDLPLRAYVAPGHRWATEGRHANTITELVTENLLLLPREHPARVILDRAVSQAGLAYASPTPCRFGAGLPFINSSVYVGPLVRSLGGADLSWLIGLVVGAVGYYACTKPCPGHRPRPVAPPREHATLAGTDPAPADRR